MNPLIQLANVVKTYGHNHVQVHALRGVTLDVQPGEFSVVAGPSGSGKTTLLNLIGGLDQPSGGSVHVDGIDTSALNRTGLSQLRLHKIGFVFQSYNLIPVLTAYENAEYVLLLQGVPVEQRRERVMALLDTVGLAGMERRFPRELSGGQQQRVAIVRAIAPGPKLILADEPTANVDSATSAALLDLMERLNQDQGVTFLFSTHDHAVMRRAHRIIVLKDGQIFSDGPPDQDGR